MSRYRVNYGNGQVGPTRKSYGEAESDLYAMDRRYNAKVQRYEGDGEWVTVHIPPKGKKK